MKHRHLLWRCLTYHTVYSHHMSPALWILTQETINQHLWLRRSGSKAIHPVSMSQASPARSTSTTAQYDPTVWDFFLVSGDSLINLSHCFPPPLSNLDVFFCLFCFSVFFFLLCNLSYRSHWLYILCVGEPGSWLVCLRVWNWHSRPPLQKAFSVTKQGEGFYHARYTSRLPTSSPPVNLWGWLMWTCIDREATGSVGEIKISLVMMLVGRGNVSILFFIHPHTLSLDCIVCFGLFWITESLLSQILSATKWLQSTLLFHLFCNCII